MAKFPRGLQRPIRIPQEFTCQQNHVSLIRSDDVIRLHRRSNEANSPGRYFGLAPDALRKGRLITRTDRNLCLRQIATGGAVHEIHAERFELT